MLELYKLKLQVALQASGCGADVTEDNVEEGEVDKLVKGLVQQVSQVTCASENALSKKITLLCSMSFMRAVSCSESARYHCCSVYKTQSLQPVTAYYHLL